MKQSERLIKMEEGARARARGLVHNYVGPEHFLLAMTDDPVLGRYLTAAGITAEAVEKAIVDLVARGEEALETISHNDAARAAMRDAQGVATEMGVDCIEPEHVLLAMLKQRNGMVFRILHDLDVTDEELERELHLLRLGRDPSTTRDLATRAEDGLERKYRLMLPSVDRVDVQVLVRATPSDGTSHEDLAAELRSQGWHAVCIDDTVIASNPAS